VVNFLEDYKIVSEYMADIHAHALDVTIFELGKTMEEHINKDCKHLEEIYKIVRTNKNEENRKELVSEYINKEDKTLTEKYGPIILMMREFGFKSNKFKENMSYFASNLSVPYTDIIRRYYTISLKKNKEFQRNMKTVEKFIEFYDTELDKLTKHEQLIREECEKNKQSKYEDWINI
jgi:transcription initiation factor IIF auxiliary subunit